MEKVLRSELEGVAKKLLIGLVPHSNRATLVTLSGELGAGKTTFVQALAKELGIKEVIQSPTYVLMKKYELEDKPFDALIHIDLYRLNSQDELKALKPEEFLSLPKTLICIEWPERVEGALPKPDKELKFSADEMNDNERYIEGI